MQQEESSSGLVAEAWVGVNCIFPGTEETMGFFTSSLMAAHSQEVSLQRIDWPSQIRAELHEPINVSDSSGPAGESEIEPHRSFSPPHPAPFYISQCLYSLFLLGPCSFTPLSTALR